MLRTKQHYEWITKDSALAWVRKPDGSVVAIPLTGERREEKRISGASDLPDILGLRQDGIAIVPVYVDYPDTKAVDFYQVDIDKGRVLPGKNHVLLPADAHIWEMSLSHAGDRIAWLFSTEIARVTEGKPTRDYILDVWLSNADGSDLKRLSGFPPHVSGHGLPGQPFSRVAIDFPIRWTIDDTAISYLQGDRLQLVKVK